MKKISFKNMVKGYLNLEQTYVAGLAIVGGAIALGKYYYETAREVGILMDEYSELVKKSKEEPEPTEEKAEEETTSEE